MVVVIACGVVKNDSTAKAETLNCWPAGKGGGPCIVWLLEEVLEEGEQITDSLESKVLETIADISE